MSSIASRPEDKQGLLVIARKENETIDIGDEITVQGMELANGGVKLGISAPKHVHVSRGDGKVTPLCETKRANERMNIERPEGVMRLYQLMYSSKSDMAQAVAPTETEVAG